MQAVVVIGLRLLDPGVANVGRDAQDLFETFLLVQALRETQRRARNAGERFGPSEQIGGRGPERKIVGHAAKERSELKTALGE